MIENMRELITEKIIKNNDSGDWVFSPVGVWAVFAMSGYTFDEVLENLGMSKKEAFSLLESLTEQSNESDELNLANLIWAIDKEWLDEIPQSDAISIESPIPSKEKADSIVKEFTKGLINEYPGDLDNAIIAFTNIITMIFEWDKPFDVKPVSDGMSFWKVDEVMKSHGSQEYNEIVGFVRDEDSNLFAVFQKYSSNSSKVISVVSTDLESRKESALSLTQDIIEGKVVPISPRVIYREGIDKGNNFEISEIRKKSDSYSVNIPAWELDYTLNLNGLFSLPADTKMIQKCVAKYQVKGFKAAAVTSMAMGSAFIVAENSYHVDLDFNKPFASAAVYLGDSKWSKIPAFVAWTETAIEPKEED